MKPVHIEIDVKVRATGATETLRFGSGNDASLYGARGVEWLAAVTSRPSLAIELMDRNLSGTVQTGKAEFSIDVRKIGLPFTQNRSWTGRAVRIWYGDPSRGDTPDFVGLIDQGRIDTHRGEMRVTATVDDSVFDEPLLEAEFGGSGGADGDPELRGTLKPAGFGPCENVPIVWFDQTNWIGMVDGYGNTVSVDKVMEGLSSLGDPVADYASYAALKTAIETEAIAPGRWGTCLAEGMIGLGAPPVYEITANVTFGSNRLGAIMQRILTVHAGVAASRIESSAFDAVDAELPYDAFYWTSQARTIRDVMQAMAASINSTPLVLLNGKFSIARANRTAPVETFNRNGATLPRVLDWETAEQRKPAWRLAVRVARPVSVTSVDDVNFVDDLIDRGGYDAANTYRAGHYVWQPDGSSWLYIALDPTSGNAPPDWPTLSNAWWENKSPPVDAVELGIGELGFRDTVSPGYVSGFGSSLNLLLDPAFNDFGTYWNRGTSTWYAATGSFFRGQLKTTKYLQIVGNGQTPSVDDYQIVEARNIPVQAFESFVHGLRYFASSGQTFAGKVRAVLVAYDQAGAEIQSFITETQTGIPSGVIATLELPSTMPDGTVSLTFKIVVMWPAGTARIGTLSVAHPFIYGRFDLSDTQRTLGLLPTASADQGLRNSEITLGEDGALVGGGGGAVTPTGLGLEDGADVTKSVTGPSSMTIQHDADGSVKAGQLPKKGWFKLIPAGGTFYSSGVTWSISVRSGTFAGTAPSISGDGQGILSINSEMTSPTATIEVSATYLGRTYPSFTVTIYKNTAEASTTGGGSTAGSSATDTSLVSFSTTSFIAVSNDLEITTPAGVTEVSLRAANLGLFPDATGVGSTNCEFKWQRYNGSTWVDVGAVVASSPDPLVGEADGELFEAGGSVTCNATATGLTGSTAYKFKLLARIQGGVTRTIYIDGSASAIA